MPMKSVSLLFVLAFLLPLAAGQNQSTPAQNESSVGDFTRSPTEHIIVTLDQPFTVRTVHGIVLWKVSPPPGIAKAPPEDPLEDVLIEIEGPGSEKTMRRAVTDRGGHFKISHVPPGTYHFKFTLNGFQSVMGTLIVSKDAPGPSALRIEMSLGV
jgi:hypothetical protein